MISRRTFTGLAAGALFAQESKLPDGIYARIQTSKGLIVARLEANMTPMTVANFVGLAEGTIANAAFDPGRPFFDGTAYHRVVPGHVIQCGIPVGGKSRGLGYQFPNEVHAKLSHNHAGALNMANSGPDTNASQWCITLGDRSYLDGDYTVFGEVVAGLDVVMKIVQGDTVESVRIDRIGAAAQAFHPTTESFQAQVKAAQQRVVEAVEKKRAAERAWVAQNYPSATGPENGVLVQTLAPGSGDAKASRVRYRGRELRYMGLVIGREGPPLDIVEFVSSDKGTPEYGDSAAAFAQGAAKINPGLDGVLETIQPGERKIAIVPSALAYGRSGSYAPEVPGKRRLVISPNAMLVYEVEGLAG